MIFEVLLKHPDLFLLFHSLGQKLLISSTVPLSLKWQLIELSVFSFTNGGNTSAKVSEVYNTSYIADRLKEK